MKIIYSTMHISGSYNNMKTYTIFKKKNKEKHKKKQNLKVSNVFLSLKMRSFCPKNDGNGVSD
jgi:hypothetical protein